MNIADSLFKIVIFITVFWGHIDVSAQTYNIWDLNGVILNFKTSPATVVCNKENYVADATILNVALSDDNGNLLIHCYPEKDNGCYVIKNSKGIILEKFDAKYVINAIGCKNSDGIYFVAVVSGQRRLNSYMNLRIYEFNDKGELIEFFQPNYGGFTAFVTFVPLTMNNGFNLLAYNASNKMLEVYHLAQNKIAKQYETAFELKEFNSITPYFVNIKLSLDGRKIVAKYNLETYIIDYDVATNAVVISSVIKEHFLDNFIFSENDKYLWVVSNNRLTRYKLDSSLDFDLDIYEDYVMDINSVGCIMQHGSDGKIYIHSVGDDYIYVISNSECKNIEDINVDCLHASCLKYVLMFPQIIRTKTSSSCSIKASFDNYTVCYGEQLKITLDGIAPFEVFYKVDNEEKSIKTSKSEIQLDNIPGKYKITKVKDSACEFSPAKDNEAEIFKAVKTPKVVSE
jgi:hypothetical protein